MRRERAQKIVEMVEKGMTATAIAKILEMGVSSVYESLDYGAARKKYKATKPRPNPRRDTLIISLLEQGKTTVDVAALAGVSTTTVKLTPGYKMAHLRGRKKPNPIHQVFLRLVAEGHSITEAANSCGFSGAMGYKIAKRLKITNPRNRRKAVRENF